ncbi:HD-domain/PDEase-like protein [Auriscalpium vulgare]|uniref:HD-domain/PDEase-like protein n=1 Tax=Auriscalpium vulgare TaxID=40419 RepID=A0ACB8RCJ9_9AGAM|nr:HD-domain/PDEase-like protein [Auriscalpium vulgare]
MRWIWDPIHDYVPFGDHVWGVVDTKHFQRLRSIKQLGTSYYVWSGASHNRFEHSLGVAHLARQMALHLQQAQPELGITDRDVRCVELAGLCHDLGHGPWSHVWDSTFIPRALKGKEWHHEHASEMMFDDMIREYKLDFPAVDVLFIKALIAGDETRCRTPAEKPFLFEIVANKRNGIDVDKFDYISRDGRAIGEQQNLSLTRLISSARVIENQICYDIKDANQIYEVCYQRFSLHKRIYNHKTVRAIEYMLVDAIMAAEPYMKIAEQIEDPKMYLRLTDNIMPFIERTENPELEEARRIFERVRNRDLYRCVDYKVFDWEDEPSLKVDITAEAIVAEAKRLFPDVRTSPTRMIEAPHDDNISPEDVAELTADHVIVPLSKMHYGMKAQNPLDSIKFYSKTRPNVCANAQKGDLSTLMPRIFGEILLRVYTKEMRFFGIVQAGYRSILERWFEENKKAESEAPGTEQNSPAATEEHIERPRTPVKRQLSKVSSFKSTAGDSGGAALEHNSFTRVPAHFGCHKSPTRPGKGLRSSSAVLAVADGRAVVHSGCLRFPTTIPGRSSSIHVDWTFQCRGW